MWCQPLFLLIPCKEKGKIAKGKRYCNSLISIAFCPFSRRWRPRPNDILSLMLSVLIRFRLGIRNKLLLAGTHNSGNKHFFFDFARQ